MKIKQLKQKLKSLSLEIRNQKKLRKDPAHNHGCGYVSGLDDNRHMARHMHVAYCLLRGRTIEQIEGNSKTDRDDVWIKAIMREYSYERETVCVGEERSEQESTSGSSVSCSGAIQSIRRAIFG